MKRVRTSLSYLRDIDRRDLVEATAARIAAMPQRGGYRCIMADFPWWWSGGKKGRPQHYERMRDREILALGDSIRDLAHPDGCWLWVWGTGAKAGIALDVARACGFRISGRGLLWIKTHKRFGRAGVPLFYPRDMLHMGTGYTTRKNAEDCWLFRRGKPKRISKNVHEIILSPLREHSRKPDAAYASVERYCDGPRADLFAREPRAGWDGFGNEATKFALEAAA